MKKTIRLLQKKEKGAVLLMALFLTMLAGLLIVPVLQRAVFHHNDAFREQNYISALHIAEAGIEEAIWQLTHADQDEEWEGWDTSNPDMYKLDKIDFKDFQGNALGEYEVYVVDPLGESDLIGIGALGAQVPFNIQFTGQPTLYCVAGVPDIDSVGSEVRVIQVGTDEKSAFSLGLFSDDDLEMGGTSNVDSFDSRVGFYGVNGNVNSNGDAGSNGDILLSGTPIIDGDAAAGGNVVVGNNATITGDVQGGMTHIDLPPVNDLVAAAKVNNNNNEIPDAIKSNGQTSSAYNSGNQTLNVASGATLTLPGGTVDNPKVYYFSSSQLNGNSKIELDGYAIIFTDGDLTWNGGTVVNNGGFGPPEKLLIMSSGLMDKEIKINGGAGFAGAIYAPSSQLKLTGGGDVYGAAVAGKIDVIGNGAFHYDEALGGTGISLGFKISEWVEKPRTWDYAEASP
ncbi:MAG: hypothetical protein KC931_01960 [Candidatus Omnitrophica bacterium]|nr:hypothetical protein [Candidatus Omnitrophota bacterium]